VVARTKVKKKQIQKESNPLASQTREETEKAKGTPRPPWGRKEETGNRNRTGITPPGRGKWGKKNQGKDVCKHPQRKTKIKGKKKQGGRALEDRIRLPRPFNKGR